MHNIINQSVDLSYYRDILLEQGRVQIANFLNADVATNLANCLLNDTPWDLTFYNGDKGDKLSFQQLNNMGKDDIDRKKEAIKKCSASEYQFLYDSYMVVTAYLEGRNPDLLLHRYLEQINSPYFIQAMKSLTGDESILKMDAQATRYSKGSFLKEHDDSDSVEGRRFAYVLSLTKDWRPDWGGLLHFTENDKVIDTLMPKFNSLNIFKVPQKHFVSSVTEYAGEERISITGWMYNK